MCLFIRAGEDTIQVKLDVLCCGFEKWNTVGYCYDAVQIYMMLNTVTDTEHTHRLDSLKTRASYSVSIVRI